MTTTARDPIYAGYRYHAERCQRRREDASAGRSKTASGWDAKGPTGGLLLGDKQNEKPYCAHRRTFSRREALPHQACSRCLTGPAAEPAAPLPLHKSMLTDVGPVELWATR